MLINVLQMWTPPYDIIVETLTGSEIEVTVNERDTIGYIKSKIQEYEGMIYYYPLHNCYRRINILRFQVYQLISSICCIIIRNLLMP